MICLLVRLFATAARTQDQGCGMQISLGQSGIGDCLPGSD
jgi:hypothetical protein